MFNDSYKDHQIEHRGVDHDQLWEDVQKVVERQNERMSAGFAFDEGEQQISSPTSGLPSEDRFVISFGPQSYGVRSETF